MRPKSANISYIKGQLSLLVLLQPEGTLFLAIILGYIPNVNIRIFQNNVNRNWEFGYVYKIQSVLGAISGWCQKD